MADGQESSASGTGKAFFDRADQVAQTGNWEFAIELYLEGIRREPDGIERGHQPLREVALKRKAQGGKGPGLIESLKRRPGKDALDNLINAEYLLAKEPGSPANAIQVLKAAQALGNGELINWIGKILLDIERQGKPNKDVLLLLTNAFDGIEEYTSGIAACEMARQLAPDDAALQEKIKELSAKDAIKKGKYEQEGDFTRSVRDMARQKELVRQDALVKGSDTLRRQIDQARQSYLESPAVTGKIIALVDALLKTEENGDENEATDVLAKAYKDTGSYQFKARIGDIKIRQMTRWYRKLVASEDKAAAIAHARTQLEFELQEYADRAANYPTDLSIKFELGKRQFLAGDYDEAIGSFQQAQRDIRRHVPALNYLGQAWARKGLFQEAAETYQRALQAEMPEEVKKEVWYNLGDTYQRLGELAKARDVFSDLAQTDYSYRDVRERLDEVRKKIEAKGQ